MSIPLIVCIAGFIIWFVNSRMTSPDGVIGEAGRIAFAIGLFFVVAGYVGTRVF